MTENMRIVTKYSNRILELIDSQEEETRSDIQGGAEAIIMGVIHECKEVMQNSLSINPKER